MKCCIVLLCLSISFFKGYAQDIESLFVQDSLDALINRPVTATFKSNRIVNLYSNESIKKKELDFNIAHRFGPMMGPYGGGKTLIGLENPSDIKFSLDYGITNRLAVGLKRVKGATAISQVIETSMKYKLLRQTVLNEVPIGVTLYFNAATTTMESNIKSNVPDYFPDLSSRISFLSQLIITRKFSRRFSLALIPTWIHYNRVILNDDNDNFSVGIGGRLKLTKRFTIVADYVYVMRRRTIADYFASNNLKLHNPLGIGCEIETGGHVFGFHLTNCASILENQSIPYTTTSWTNKGFRLGFNITRTFALGKKHDKKK